MFFTPLDVRHTAPWRHDEREWTLLADLVYEDAEFGLLTVPVGFQTDFESVPRGLPFAYSLAKGRCEEAAVIHDYCWRELVPAGRMDRAAGNRVFTRAMADSQVNALVRWYMRAGVELGRLGAALHPPEPRDAV